MEDSWIHRHPPTRETHAFERLFGTQGLLRFPLGVFLQCDAHRTTSEIFMIHLFAAATSNGLRARITLEECELPYSLHMVDLAAGQQKNTAFIAMNPNGQIPVLVDDEGPGAAPLTLYQTGAVMLYCAEKARRFIPQDAVARAQFMQAYMATFTDIGGTFNALWVLSATPPQDPRSWSIFSSRFRGYLGTWDRILSNQATCTGDEMTLADFSLYAAYMRTLEVDATLLEGFSYLREFSQRIGERPAVMRARNWII